jgi:hypothetical protein
LVRISYRSEKILSLCGSAGRLRRGLSLDILEAPAMAEGCMVEGIIQGVEGTAT